MPQANKTDSPSSAKPIISRLVDFAPGAPDDFTGTWTRLRIAPWKYPNSASGKYMTFLLIDIEPDEDSGFEPFTQPYTMGFLPRTESMNSGTMPSNDGETPTLDLDLARELGAGDASLSDEEVEQYSGSTWCGGKPGQNLNWWELAESLSRSGMTYDEFPSDVTGFEGLRCHMNRMPSKNQGKKKEGEEAKEFKILKVTEIIARPGDKKGKSGASNKPAASKPATSSASASTSSNGTGSLEDRVREEVLALLSSGTLKFNDNGQISKKLIQGKVVSKFKGKEQTLSLKIVNDDKFHEESADQGLYLYDVDEGMITPLEAE